MEAVLPAPTKPVWRSRYGPEAAILCVALLLRLLFLELKPPHFDEGVNGFFVDGMTRTGYYHYDPTNFHGPLHFYVLFLFQTLFGRHIWAFRLPIALFSAGCVAVALAYRRYLSVTSCRIAATALAISPAMTFYGRYAIHESFLLLSLMVCTWGAIGLYRRGERLDLWAAALGLTGMILTKETYIIHVCALLLAYPALRLLEIVSPSSAESRERRLWTEHDFKVVLGVCGGVIVFFYSGGFLDWSALPGFWTTFLTWTKTGADAKGGHAKEWWYWLRLLWEYEWVTLAALAGTAWLAWPKGSRSLRYLALGGLGTLVAYSIIHYKTPWCLIVIIWPFFFVLGALLEHAWTHWPPWARATLTSMAAVALSQCFYQAIHLNFFHFADPLESYAYVQTLPTLSKIMDPLEHLTKRDPAYYQLRGKVLFEAVGDGHPLPWLLGDFPHVAFLSADSPPGKPGEMTSDFLLVEDSYVADIEDRLQEDYFRESFTFRGNSGVECYLYWKASVFASEFPGRSPEFHPHEESPPLLDPADAPPDPDPAEEPATP